jgi:UDP-N-acetylmuramoyl-tripeptide--D-alanyl-D-alanine ligase
MKNLAKNMILGFLVFLARVRLKRLNPYIIGVTGSVGKTSTKEAIYAVLKSKFLVYRSEKSYNSEFGLPLSILGVKSGFSSPAKWLGVLFMAVWNAFFGARSMRMMIAEMGVDKPGDMNQLLKLITPQTGVLTAIKPVHLAEGQFKDLEDIFNEKKKLVETLPEKGTAIMNADDPYIMTLRGKLQCRTIFYGYAEWADLRVLECGNTDDGLAFSIVYNDETAEGVIPALGDFNIYIALPAIAAGISQGIALKEAAAALTEYALPPGRMNPVKGINDSLIIDSSYNASPESVKEALNVLAGFKGRRIAVIGNMNELGESGENKHREVGAFAADKTDLFLTVGAAANILAEGARMRGFDPEKVRPFENALQAAEYLKQVIQPGDTILVKGSQNKVRLERLVKRIMLHPERAQELLVRQEPEWEKID